MLLNDFLISDLVEIVMEYLLINYYFHKHFICDPSTKIYKNFVKLVKSIQKFSVVHTNYTYKNICNERINKYDTYNVNFIGKINKSDYIYVSYNILANYNLSCYKMYNIQTTKI